MTETHAWTGTPVKPHPGARNNGAASLPWGTRRQRLPLNWPFAKAVDGFRSKALGNPEYDPASTFVWGQMMAVGLIEMLKAIEADFDIHYCPQMFCKAILGVGFINGVVSPMTPAPQAGGAPPEPTGRRPASAYFVGQPLSTAG